VALGSTQPLTDMSTRNLPGGKGSLSVRLATSTLSVSQLSRKCRSLDILQPWGPSRPVTEIGFFFSFFVSFFFVFFFFGGSVMCRVLDLACW
jgi:hypothetical protein